MIDLEKQRIRRLYSTVAWGYQLEANVQWGPDDQYVYTNDVIDGEAVCVRIDLNTGETYPAHRLLSARAVCCRGRRGADPAG